MSKTYETRGVAEPHNHKVYDEYIKALGLKDSERLDLKKRGLNEEQIKKAQYSTKQINTTLDTANALGRLKTSGMNLDNVPGFFVDDKTGHNNQSKVSGLLIPVRDYNGHIASLLCRNDKAKIGKSGKIENKYIAFSSAGKTKGNKVRQTTHCPIIKGAAIECDSTSIRITEGVLKADVATAIGDKYCIGMQGLNIQDDLPVILNELEIQELVIAIDAGEDDNFDILRCKAKLVKLCRDIGIDFKIEIWDIKCGKGIDDVLSNKNGDKIRFATDEEVDAILDKANEADYNNGEWIYNNHEQNFININTEQVMNKSQFADWFHLEKVEFTNKIIAGGFTQVARTTFLPGGELFVNEKGLRCLNTWKDPKIVAIEGDITPFLKHLEYILPDAHQRNILLDWIAHNIQRPGIKILWALVLIGDEGIGKSIIGHMMKQILGESNVGCPTNEQLHEPYTDWQKNKQLLIIEELMTKGKIELINKLKPCITQPTCQIREMRMTSYMAPNRYNIIAFTNYEDALLLNDKDRRYGILKSDAKMLDEKYYQPLWDWIKSEKNIQALYHFFMQRDLSHFNPNAKAPDTAAKQDMINMSLTLFEEWVKNGIAEYAYPFNRDIIVTRHVKDRVICPNNFERLSDHKWASALEKFGAVQYGQQIKMSDKSTARPWIMGSQKEILLKLSPAEVAQRYEATSLDYKGMNPLEVESFENKVIPFTNESNPVKEDEPL